MYIEGLDELDNKIIEVVKENARLTYSEIGEKVGVPRISVKKRMEALEEKGIIQGYKAVIDSTKLPEGVRFILDLETTPECFEDIVEGLSRSKYIRQIYGVSGDCAIHATGFVSNSRNLQIFANALYREAKRGIRRMSYKTVLSTLMDIDGGVDYVAENFNIQMEKPVIKCIHSDKNNQCIKERCPFHE